MKLYRISLPYATYGITTGDDGIVIEAPPIAKWMKGEFILDVIRWVKRKHGIIKEVKDD